jgi:hypothetical protein
VRVGDVVLKRSIYRGNVRWTFPHRVAGEWDGRIGIYCGPGNRGKAMRRGPGGYLERWVSDAPPFDTTWAGTHVLRFERAGDAHSVEIYWREDWTLAGWYVNLQAPTVVNGRCFDTTDWVLDITIDPDGSWSWKDEDELAQAIGLGIFDEDAAEALRAEGRRVVADEPWPTGWEEWRPPADWRALPLPVDWHVV